MRKSKLVVFLFIISLMSSKTFALNCSILSQTGADFSFQEVASYNFLKGYYEGYQYPLKVDVKESKNFIARVYKGCKDSEEKTIFNIARATILLGPDEDISDQDLFPEKTRDYGNFSCTSIAPTLDFEGRQSSQILQYFNNGLVVGRFNKAGKKPTAEDFELYDKFFFQSCGYMDNDRDIAQHSISEVLKMKGQNETEMMFSGEQVKDSETESRNSKNKSATSVPE